MTPKELEAAAPIEKDPLMVKLEELALQLQAVYDLQEELLEKFSDLNLTSYSIDD